MPYRDHMITACANRGCAGPFVGAYRAGALLLAAWPPLPCVQTSVSMSSSALQHKASLMQRRLLDVGARYVISR